MRSSGDEENEDTAQLLKDIQKVREDLAQSEGEATSRRHSVSGVAGSDPSFPRHSGQHAPYTPTILPCVLRDGFGELAIFRASCSKTVYTDTLSLHC